MAGAGAPLGRTRALLVVLVAAHAASAAPAPPPPAPAPAALLVLRAACGARDPAALATQRLESYAAAAGRPSLRRRPLRLLTYPETCGLAWREAVMRGALAALGAGGAVVCVGWPGAAACDALGAAARALHLPQPGACAATGARAAALAHLAVRLHWRRARLQPPAAGDDECAAALLHAERSLGAAGLSVRRTPFHEKSVPHVVILCASGREAVPALSAALHAAPAGAPAVLLLRDASLEPTLADNAFPMSNLTLDLVNSPYTLERDTPGSGRTTPARRPRSPPDTSKQYEQRFPSPTFAGAINNRPAAGPVKNNDGEMSPQSFLETYNNRSADAKQTLVKTKVRNARRATSSLEVALLRRVLVLSEERLEAAALHAVYEQALDALDRAADAERARSESAHHRFYLYERSGEGSGGDAPVWRRLVTLATNATRALDAADDWTIAVTEADAADSLVRWDAAGTGEAVETGAPGAGAGALWPAVLGVFGMLGLALGAAVAWRGAAARKAARRRRGDVVLSARDFTFPAEERGRRVGAGMETMLSCWLQQLHEFGGPELERARPDLLPSATAPSAPSASVPSSTTSVNVHDTRTRYKGDVVHVKHLPVAGGTASAGGAGGGGAPGGGAGGTLELRRRATDVLLLLQGLRHENINPFIGCVVAPRPALVWEACGRGSLEDVLMADDIKLDWTFRLSLLTDLVRGLRYVHSSPLRAHGRLSSRNCVVDSRWVLRLTDYGLPAFYRAQGLPAAPRPARELLWTAPELLREGAEAAGRATQPGDVFSFAIIMQEVIVRGEPYCMLALTPEEIVEKLCRPPPLIRPSVSMSAAPPEVVSAMRQCWAEAADARPDVHRLHETFRHLHRGRKVNIVDSMFEMLEKYSNNLEELIRERTEQLDMEKKKTEQLLNRMLPRSVAERLLLGSRVEPEEFDSVSIYFSDIVGFTALAARSTPVQVVALLNDLYTTFDAAIERYKVYKVETIGDAYMVVGGLPAGAPDHAESVATMALHLLHLAGRFRVRHLPATPLHLRIGLHSGPCCAGVVGLTMPRYCLFGDTVNTASRMESTGAAWRIQVSAATAELLTAAGGYRLRSRGLVMIKGKGAMHTYWLLGKDGFDKPLPTPPPLQSEEVLFEADGESEPEAQTLSPAAPEHLASAREAGQPTSSALSAPTTDMYVWQPSGTVSAESSPPPAPATAPPPAPFTAPPQTDHSAPYARYRCLTGGASGARVLRRQWSLERGEALAAARAAGECSTSAPAPLALELATAPAGLAGPAPARYRTRPEPDALNAVVHH